MACGSLVALSAAPETLVVGHSEDQHLGCSKLRYKRFGQLACGPSCGSLGFQSSKCTVCGGLLLVWFVPRLSDGLWLLCLVDCAAPVGRFVVRSFGLTFVCQLKCGSFVFLLVAHLLSLVTRLLPPLWFVCFPCGSFVISLVVRLLSRSSFVSRGSFAVPFSSFVVSFVIRLLSLVALQLSSFWFVFFFHLRLVICLLSFFFLSRMKFNCIFVCGLFVLSCGMFFVSLVARLSPLWFFVLSLMAHLFSLVTRFLSQYWLVSCLACDLLVALLWLVCCLACGSFVISLVARLLCRLWLICCLVCESFIFSFVVRFMSRL